MHMHEPHEQCAYVCGGGRPNCQKKQQDPENEPLKIKHTCSNYVIEAALTNIVDEVLRSPGQPLDENTRGFFEPRFGQDFSGVRVHTDGQAAQSSESLNARAYTVGQNIVFGAGYYRPGNMAGQRLLAHELTHVLQQTHGIVPPSVQREPSKEEVERIKKLNEDYEAAILAKDWSKAAELLNAFNREDILARLQKLKRGEIANLHAMAKGDKKLGPESQVALLTRAAYLDINYENEQKKGNWVEAAQHLNGFNDDDILALLLDAIDAEQLALVAARAAVGAGDLDRARAADHGAVG